MKNAPDLNGAFAEASKVSPESTAKTAPSQTVTSPKAVSEDGRIVTMDLYDMNGTYSIGRDVTGGMTIAIATKDYTFLISPDWAARGSFEAYAYDKNGKGGTVVWANGDTNSGGDKQASAAYLDARKKWEQTIEQSGPGGNRVFVEGTVSGRELMDAARTAYNEQTEWKASLAVKSTPAPSPVPAP